MGCPSPPDLSLDARAQDPAWRLKQFQQEHGPALLFAADSAGRREALQDHLSDQGIKTASVADWADFLNRGLDSAITTGPLEHGAWIPAANLCVIAEAELYGQRVMQRRRRKRSSESENEATLRDLSELRVGAPLCTSTMALAATRDCRPLKWGATHRIPSRLNTPMAPTSTSPSPTFT